MTDILHQIIADKAVEVESQKARTSQQEWLAACRDMPPCRSMAQAIRGGTGIIAEFKRKSPSKGWINTASDPAEVAAGYLRGGASAMSVLTDTPYFGGTLDDLRRVRRAVALPLLRKDFVVDSYQIAQARAAGADAVLLIAAALTPGQCADYAGEAHALGLETLLEIHSEAELAYITPDIDMVGVNNRNLGTFHTDVANSHRLAPLLPGGMVRVSESGISNPLTIKALREAGYSGFLIGETFMKTPDPAQALADFADAIR